MFQVAIIGAGFSGLALALALHQQSIPCTVYEARPDAPLNIGGAVMLSPNALKILDKLGVYSRILPQSYKFSKLEYRDTTTLLPSLINVQAFGGQEEYGYDALRTYRTELISALLGLLDDAGLKIHYGKKFSHIVEETPSSVTWKFADGEERTATLLIGADGIHSAVRKYIYPDLRPEFVGMAGVTASVPTSQVKLPADLHLPVTYTHPESGSFVMAPQLSDGSEIFFGKQTRVPGNPSRADWDALLADKGSLTRFLQEGNDNFPEIVHNAVSHIAPERINVWPFYRIPKLENWSSAEKHGRVIILGDAAHAIPPTAGQGINQAFEDVYMFARLLKVSGEKDEKYRKGDGSSLEDALKFWQDYRQARVDRVLELNAQIDRLRLPQGDKTGEMLDLDLGWLYSADFEAVVGDWVKDHDAKEVPGSVP